MLPLPPAPPPAAKRISREVSRAEGAPGSTITPGCAQTTGATCCATPAALPRRNPRAFLEAENAYGDAVLAPLDAACANTLAAEMRARLKDDDSDPPTPDGPVGLLRALPSQAGSTGFIAAPRARAARKPCCSTATPAPTVFCSIGHARHSPDHSPLRLERRRLGRGNIRNPGVCDIGGADLPDVVPQTTGEFVWTARRLAAFFYVRQDEDHRPYQIRLHRLGEPAEADALIFEENGPRMVRGTCARTRRGSARLRLTFTAMTRRSFIVVDLESPGDARRA